MNTQALIAKQLSEHAIVLYMKGTPLFPQCGFSAKSVHLVQSALGDQAKSPQVLYVNVLTDPALRTGIKQHGQWPTIPQLYIKGELVGGSDIMQALFDSGDLQKQLLSAI